MSLSLRGVCPLGCECHEDRNSIGGCSLPHTGRLALTLPYSGCQLTVCCRVKFSVELRREAGVDTHVLGELVGRQGAMTLNNHDPAALSLGGLCSTKHSTCVSPPSLLGGEDGAIPVLQLGRLKFTENIGQRQSWDMNPSLCDSRLMSFLLHSRRWMNNCVHPLIFNA